MVINLCFVPLHPKILGMKQRYSAFTEARFKPQYLSELRVCYSNNDDPEFGSREVLTKRGDFCDFQTSLSLFLHHHCSITEHSCLISGMLRSHSSTRAGTTWMCCRTEGRQGPAPSPWVTAQPESRAARGPLILCKQKVQLILFT